MDIGLSAPSTRSGTRRVPAARPAPLAGVQTSSLVMVLAQVRLNLPLRRVRFSPFPTQEVMRYYGTHDPFLADRRDRLGNALTFGWRADGLVTRRSENVLKRRALGLIAGLLLGASAAVATATPSGADVTVVSGGAFGHYTKVGLFGGPAVPVGPLPDVRLPKTGSEQPLTAREAAGSAVYGPARIFGGVWPAGVDVAPPSGPTVVTTKGTLGPNGSVTSSVDIVLRTPPDPKSPGGFGPLPPTHGDELHTTCTANERGVTGSTRLVNAVMSKSTTPDGEPLEEEKIPDVPPVNYTRTGVLTNIGDRYRIVYNEHIVDPDGSLTVNGVHIYLLGDIAVGESIIGQVRCSARGAAFGNTPPSVAAPPDTSPATTAAPPVIGAASAPTAPADDAGGAGPLPLVIGGAVVVAGGAFAASRSRRRGGTRRQAQHDP